MRKNGPGDGTSGPRCEPCDAPSTRAGKGTQGPAAPNDYSGQKRTIRGTIEKDATPPSGGKRS